MQQRLIALIQKDHMRMQALQVVATLGLPQSYIVAGFVRNLIWDDLHHFKQGTPLNDVDVIYFAPDEAPEQEKQHQIYLQTQMPELNWQIKNQAYTHLKHQHQAYESVFEAMSYWPEQETAIAIRLQDQQYFEIISVFALEQIFEGYIRHNPKAPKHVFEQRINQKKWQQHWTKLKLE